MYQKFIRTVSILLVLILTLNTLPLQSFADELVSGTQAKLSVTEEITQPITVLQEITEKRTEYSKEFLLSNGLHMATLYADPVHYEQNGQWVDIDNTLTAKADGTYTNTAGIWSVAFPQQFGSSQMVTITKDGYTLSFGMPQRLTSGNTAVMSADAEALTASVAAASTAQIEALTELTAAKLEAQHPETVLDKLSSRLTYENVHSGTDVVYDLTSNRVKESVVLSQYDSTLQGFRYVLSTGSMIPVLAEEGHITFYDATQTNVVMVMPAPFMQDSAMEISTDIDVSLVGKDGKYVLTYLLPQSWVASSQRQWPILLDPVVQADLEITNVRDASVAEYTTFSYTSPTLETGYYGGEGRQRTYLKYAQLPTLTSADVVVEATITLKKFADSSTSAPVEVHKVLGAWQSESITWSNMPNYDTTIEDFVICQEERTYKWDITDIAREWYATGNNFGMLFKTSDAVENAGANNYKQFYSSDFSNYNDSIPVLEILFRNNNGIEDYWDYSSASASRAGTGYVNTFTGNLVWTRNDMGFTGNRMPVAISHVYNANDAGNNLFGLGYGWRTNYHQRVYQWTENTAYYVWEDSDGTAHYFAWNAEKSAYVDEDGLQLQLTVSGSGASRAYTLTDEKDNKSYFDSNGRLYKLENNQATKSSVQIAYTDTTGYLISKLTDGAGRVYELTYPGGLLSRISFKGTGSTELTYVTFGYSGSNLVSITDKDGKGCAYTYHSNHILATAAETGGYKLSYTYNNPTGSYAPWRVKTVQEFDGTVPAGQLTFTYGGNQTVLTSSHYENGSYVQDSTLTYQFNDFGNTVAVQDDEGKAQFMEFSKNIWNEETGTANQLSLSSKLQNTVVNVRGDGSFEWGEAWVDRTGNLSMSHGISTTEAYIGNKSQMISGCSGEALYTLAITVKPQETYTFSGYVMTTAGKAKLGFCKTSNLADAVYSDETGTNGQWTRLQVSYTNETEANETIYALFMGVDSATAYLDCVQIEKAPTASRYNLVSVGDFQWSSNQWRSTNTGTGDGLAIAPSSAPGLKTQAYKLVGDYTSRKYISQDIKVIGQAGDSFVFSGWAMGNSAAMNKVDTEVAKEFGLKLTITNTDGSTTTNTVQFNPDVTDWQFACAALVAEKAYSSVTLEAIYGKNANTVYFDGLQVFKEEYGSSFTYDADGKVTSVIDLQNKETKYEYDGNDLTKIIEDGQTKMTYTYDNYHNVLTATTQEQLTYHFTYDTYGNNKSVSITSNGQTISSSATYTANGNLLASTTDALGQVTAYGYNADTGLQEWVEFPEDDEPTRTRYTYDNMYRTASIAANTNTELNLSANYTYNADDLLATIQTPTTTYSFTYGNFDLRSAVSIGNRTLASYSYDSKNQLDRLTYGNADFVDYDYDSKGRLIKQTYETGETVEYAYDNSGNLATVTDSATGITTTYYYDLLDRQVGYREKSATVDHSVTCIYNEDNQIASVTETVNGVTTTYSYTYDEDNRVTAMTVGDVTVSYSYDGFGRLQNRTVKNGDTVIQSSTPTYAPGSVANSTTGRISSYNGYTYTYDGNGNVLTINDGTYTTSYEYDSANQLVRENNQAQGFTHTWTYDSAGNIQNRKEYTYTTGVLGSAIKTVYYDYIAQEWEDLLTSYGGNEFGYDIIGNLTNDGEWTYTWQNGKELSSMTKGNTTWTFTYDANGMRTGRTNGAGQSSYTYVYQGSKLVRMIMDAQDYADIHFTYDANGVPLTITENGYTYYYVTNLQGDVIGIKDSAGNQFVTYIYDAWGNLLYRTNTQLADYNPLRYRGYVYDYETGLYYLQSRYYNPQWGRFINADCYVATGQGLLGNNMFAYCRNNPVKRKDVSGTEDVCVEDYNEDNNPLNDLGSPSGTGSGGGSGGAKVGGGSGGNGNPSTGGQTNGAGGNGYGNHASSNTSSSQTTPPKFTPDQQAVLDLAKELKNGVTQAEARILVDYANEYGISNHEPMIHDMRSGIWSYTLHINIRNIHIPVYI